jgi:hypothetical protein
MIRILSRLQPRLQPILQPRFQSIGLKVVQNGNKKGYTNRLLTTTQHKGPSQPTDTPSQTDAPSQTDTPSKEADTLWNQYLQAKVSECVCECVSV